MGYGVAQVGNKVIITWQMSLAGHPAPVTDTLELVNGELHAHFNRDPCPQCAHGTTLGLTYVRGAKY